MKTRLSLAKEGHAFSCISKILKKVPKTRLYLSKRQHHPQRTHLPPAVPAKRELPSDSRWRHCSVAKQPKQLMRTLISCVLLPSLTLQCTLDLLVMDIIFISIGGGNFSHYIQGAPERFTHWCFSIYSVLKDDKQKIFGRHVLHFCLKSIRTTIFR